jgi:hypothetical protein
MFYMSPEALEIRMGWKDPQVIPQMDVYSFSLILWEMVTHKLPMRELDPLSNTDHTRKVIGGFRPCVDPTDDITLPEDIRCFVPLLEKCWNGEPSNRPPFTQIVDRIDEIRAHYYLGLCPSFAKAYLKKFPLKRVASLTTAGMLN